VKYIAEKRERYLRAFRAKNINGKFDKFASFEGSNFDDFVGKFLKGIREIRLLRMENLKLQPRVDGTFWLWAEDHSMLR
jgi:hypothetical protein